MSNCDHAERWDYMQELLSKAAPNKETKKKRKYIHRVDDEKRKAHYWTVNIIYDNQRYNKTFADGKNGGKTSALLAAVGWRDKKIKELGLVFQQGLKKQPTHVGSKGIYYKEKRKNGNTYTYMIAYWHETIKDKRTRRYKAFSIHKHGYRKAKSLAAKFRKDKLKELYG